MFNPLKNMIFSRVGWYGLLICCGSVSANEQDTIHSLVNLSLEELLRVKVTVASKVPESILTSAGTTYVITRQEIQQYGWRDLREVLRAIPNLELEWTHNLLKGGHRGFRGNFNRTLLLIDGRKWNDVFSEEVLITDASFPTHLIERVEVLQGPNASVYGTEAMEGVINIVTRLGEKGADGREVSVSLEEANTQYTTGFLRHSGRNYLVAGSFSHFESDRDWDELADFNADFENFSRNPTLDKARVTDPDRFSARGEDKTLDLYARYRNTYGGFHFKRIFSDVALQFVRMDVNARTADREQWMAFAGHRHKLGDRSELKLEYHYTRSDDDFSSVIPTLSADGGAVVSVRDQQLEHDSVDHRIHAQLDSELGRHHLVAGWEWQQRDSDKFDLAQPGVELFGGTGEWNKQTAFAQDSYRFNEQFILTAGLSYLKRDFIDDNILPRLSLVYRPTPASALKLTHGEGERGPSVFEVAFARETLPPQIMVMRELNYSHKLRSGDWQWLNSFSVYEMTLKNQYQITVAGVGDENRQTIAAGSDSQFGLENHLRFTYANKLSGFLSLRRLRLDEQNYTLSPIGVDDPHPLEQVNTVLDMARWKGSLGLSYRWSQHIQAAIFAEFWSEQHTKTHDVALTREIIHTVDPQYQVNLNLRFGEYRWAGQRIDFALHVENLFNNAFYHTNPRGASPVQILQTPRSLRGTVRVSF